MKDVMEQQQMGRGTGGKPGGEFSSKTSVLSTRITQDLRDALAAASAASGRTLSQEIEFRLRSTFAESPRIDPQTATILEILGMVISQLRSPNPKKTATRWYDDRYLWHQVVSAALTILNLYRPRTAKPIIFTPPYKILEGRDQGATFAGMLVNDVVAADPAVPMTSPGASHQLQLAALRERMGEDLADRPEPFGMTSKEYQQLSSMGREFGELMRKVRRARDAADPADLQKIRHLIGRLQALIPDKQENAA
jgi:hypothetical protein